jgi:hypothetical protein
MEKTHHSNIIKLREHPKAKQYNPDARKTSEEERVMAFEFPFLPIPKEQSFLDKSKVVMEIYKITSKTSKKSYVGQAVSHIMNQGKYRRHGTEGRFKRHVEEAVNNTKRKQCVCFNNAIRKYGADDFSMEVIAVCLVVEADYWETIGIELHGTMAPHGYNLKHGGQHFQHTEQSRSKVAHGVKKFFDEKRLQRLIDAHIPKEVQPESIIHPLYRDKKQYGWYILYNAGKNVRIKADFGGRHLDLQESYVRALECIKHLQEKKA